VRDLPLPPGTGPAASTARPAPGRGPIAPEGYEARLEEARRTLAELSPQERTDLLVRAGQINGRYHVPSRPSGTDADRQRAQADGVALLVAAALHADRDAEYPLRNAHELAKGIADRLGTREASPDGRRTGGPGRFGETRTVPSDAAETDAPQAPVPPERPRHDAGALTASTDIPVSGADGHTVSPTTDDGDAGSAAASNPTGQLLVQANGQVSDSFGRLSADGADWQKSSFSRPATPGGPVHCVEVTLARSAFRMEW
jgi:hypothetical protein